ncbi:MAG: carboxypeptidase-like regulatory domain-containing protein, partial [Pyrinomonadaceae bacterium]
SVSGRVTNGKRGVARARVYMTGQNGETQTTITNSFGYFRFSDGQAGETYIISVFSKSYTFTPQVITLSENLDNLDFSPM